MEMLVRVVGGARARGGWRSCAWWVALVRVAVPMYIHTHYSNENEIDQSVMITTIKWEGVHFEIALLDPR